ncbi:MAG: 6-pyruvoyl-tetrahydropterin synthase-related protein [Polyangia bacterium]
MTEKSDSAVKADSSRNGRQRRIPGVILPGLAILFALLYMLAILYYEPPGVLFGDDPISGRDYDTHVGQVWRVTEALDGWGESWAYDPQHLAGCPNGIIFDADNKGWEIWTYALWKLGLPRGTAFNMFVLLAHLLLPLVVYTSSRLFGLERWTALLATFLAACLWFFDGFIHWAWWEGMLAYSMVCYLALLPLALFYRFTKEHRWRHVLALAPVLAAAHLIHPYVFFILFLPMGALYVRHFSELRARHHLAIVAVALVTLAVNSYWLIVAIRFWHYILDSGYMAAGTAEHLLFDYLGIVSDRSVTGGSGIRSGFRFLGLGAAAITFVMWWRTRDSRLLPLAVGVIAMLTATYLGGYLRALQQVQPYRFVAPAAFFAVIPAAGLAGEIRRRRALAGLPRIVYALGAIAIIAAAPRLVRDVLYFVEALVPATEYLEEENPKITDTIGFGNIGYPRHKEFRHGPMPPDYVEIIEWFEEHYDGSGRVMVEHWTIGEMLPWKTDVQVLGGFRLRNIAHSMANFFRRHPLGDPPEDTLERYMDTYAVGWVVSSFTHERFEAHRRSLRKVAEIGTHRIFRSRRAVSFLRGGAGEVSASLNRIEVSGTDPERDAVLKFHWMETLVCEPGCEIEREPLENDPVGFIRVPAPHPESFTIVNRY